MRITATDLNKRPGTYLERALMEPVLVEKIGRPSVVIISYDRFLELEDAYWGELALESEKDTNGTLSGDDAIAFLSGDD